MSDAKFRIIHETKLGTLDETMRSELERLSEERERLEALQDEHDEAQDAFWDAVTRQFGERIDELNVAPNYRVTPEGDVFVDFCKCPACQAPLHGMSVSETVEAMHKNDLLPPGSLAAQRARAKAVDSKNEVSKKMRN